MDNLSQNNVSFNFLRNSSDFLNLILQNITSCVLLLNDKMELVAYNDAVKTIFSNKKDEDIFYHRCGEVIGCAYNVEEKKDCGKTSQCSICELRVSAINSYLKNEVIYKEMFSRPFYLTSGEKVEKHLQFSTRLFHFENDKYIIMMIEDITKFVNLKRLLSKA